MVRGRFVHSFIIAPWLPLNLREFQEKMATTCSVSRKSKRRADSIEGQPVRVSAPPVARPTKKRKLEETDALDAGTLTGSSRTHSTARTQRRSEEVTRRRRKARLLQRASTRVRIQLDKPRSPSPVALPTPSSVKEEYIEEEETVAADEADDELTKLRAELAAKDRVRGVAPPCADSETSTLTRTYTSDC